MEEKVKKRGIKAGSEDENQGDRLESERHLEVFKCL